jgi:hypothetical protein
MTDLYFIGQILLMVLGISVIAALVLFIFLLLMAKCERFWDE